MSSVKARRNQAVTKLRAHNQNLIYEFRSACIRNAWSKLRTSRIQSALIWSLSTSCSIESSAKWLLFTQFPKEKRALGQDHVKADPAIPGPHRCPNSFHVVVIELHKCTSKKKPGLDIAHVILGQVANDPCENWSI